MDHVLHDHDHAGHDHDHGSEVRDYYIEQLLTVFISAGFGVTGVLMYRFKMLEFILAEPFRLPVLLGGFGLIALALFRGAALWMAVGGDHFHDHHAGHDHKPGEACEHPTEEEAHEEHSHGNMYWRIVVLAFPILLFLMGVPNGTFSQDWMDKRLGAEHSIGALGDVAEKGGENTYDFQSLSSAASSPEKREALTGTKATVKGQIKKVPGSQTEFSLYRLVMTCCITDAVPLKARVVASSTSIADAFASQFKENSWVEVTGTLQFVRDSTGQFVTVLRVKDKGGIVPTTPQN